MARRVLVRFSIHQWQHRNMDRPQGKAVIMRKAAIAMGIILLAAIVAACNPFAPKLTETPATTQFGDPHTVPGYFQAFKYAYEFRDTTLYGTLLAPDFIFSYRDYNRGVDIQWGRDDDMRATAGLFQYAQDISLLWGDAIDSTGTATSFDITLVFSLDVTFNPDDIEHVDGRAVFHLERASPSDPWKAGSWQDESNL